MKSISTFALAAALVVGGAVVTAPFHPAEAAKKKKAEAAATTGEAARQLVISPAARPAMGALDKAVKAKDKAAFDAALPAAEAAATTPDEKYFVARQRYQFARDANDEPGQLTALEAIIASGGAQPSEAASANFNLGVKAFGASNWARAETAFTKAIELNPTDTDAMFNLGVTQLKLKKDAEALASLQRAIAGLKSANKPVPEGYYKTALQSAFSARNPSAVALSGEVYTAYPTAENWRNSLIVFRDSVRTDEAANTDVLRLMRASKALGARAEYYDLASSLSDAGLPGEAKAVLEEGQRATVTPPIRTTDQQYVRIMSIVGSRLAEDRASLAGLEGRAASAATGRLAYRTADAYLGYGDYAKAIALYRVAQTKGGADVDAELVKLHLGMALAMSGDKAGAETALKSVTGKRAGVAQMWLNWLAHPAA
ncbi:MAG TPA: tetratricopeptide repeat protein [Allosphingosinicella sp.]|nr:tetratricopeptide repeat protein [Allosphingosinicella sp.]